MLKFCYILAIMIAPLHTWNDMSVWTSHSDCKKYGRLSVAQWNSRGQHIKFKCTREAVVRPKSGDKL